MRPMTSLAAGMTSLKRGATSLKTGMTSASTLWQGVLDLLATIDGKPLSTLDDKTMRPL